MMVQTMRQFSVTGFSKSDTQVVCAAAVHAKACAVDTLYATWHDNQIKQGNDEIKQRDLRVCDHPHLSNRCEDPDQLRPPISYMEELRVFKTLVSHAQSHGALLVLLHESR